MPVSRIVLCLIAAVLGGSGVAIAKDQPVVADEMTRELLRAPDIEQMRISPDGKLLAIVRHYTEGSVVSVHRSDSMALVSRITPGKGGVITTLDWFDDDRLLIGAVLSDPHYGTPMAEPNLYVVRSNAQDMFKLPGNFAAAIDGDPDHILVSSCKKYVDAKKGCQTQIHRADIHKSRSVGELLATAPMPDARLYLDRHGNSRLAYGIEDDGNGKTWVHVDGKESWALINDAAQTGLEVVPRGISRDGLFAFLQTERRGGTDVVETYEFATGERKLLFVDDASDPLEFIRSLDQKELIGAIYGATDPRARFWKSDEPEETLQLELAKAFPGRMARITSASKDGMVAVVWTSGDHDPGTYYLFERQLHNADTLARTRPWLKPEQLGTQSPVALTARDGLPLQGLLTLPPGAVRKNLPLVVFPHGGPYGVMERAGFDTDAQILATHGYAVLQLNFRGSNGYGRDFINRGAMQWGRAMQDDLTDATKWAVGQGIADAGRICIYGASYGGYAALMGVAREPGLYRCAVGLSGVFDLSKLYVWGSIGRSEYGKHYLKTAIGQDRADLVSRSPAYLAERITVPVLLAHGLLDERVDYRHARLMRDSLEKRGVPVQLVEYPRTGHTILLDDYELDFQARLLQFLDENIGTAAAAKVARP